MTDFDPGKVMAEVEEAAQRLEKAADQLYKATERFEQAEERYEHAMATFRLKADMAYDKLPSQDRRQDLALRNVREVDPELYTEYFAAKAEKEALAVRYRSLAAATSARQSVLKALGGMGG